MVVRGPCDGVTFCENLRPGGAPAVGAGPTAYWRYILERRSEAPVRLGADYSSTRYRLPRRRRATARARTTSSMARYASIEFLEAHP